MKEFDPHLVLQQCCPKPLDEGLKVSVGDLNCYRMITPFAYCSWARGFYFQPVILEFSFQKFAANHSSKTTFILTRWNPTTDPFKKVTELDGNVSEYPVLSFYICVNRDLFPPLGPHHNEIEWLASITPRTKGIAHELLYADQYARDFNPSTGKVNRSIEIPTVDQEDALLCPSYQIEATLHSIEKGFCIRFQNEADFLSQQATKAVQDYYLLWLKNYGVERDVCHRKTCAYLQSPMRSHYGTIEKALERCMKNHKIAKIDPLTFKNHINNNTAFAVEFLRDLNVNGCSGYSVREITHHTLILLNRKNGH
jgi:hypothetical protein